MGIVLILKAKNKKHRAGDDAFITIHLQHQKKLTPLPFKGTEMDLLFLPCWQE